MVKIKRNLSKKDFVIMEALEKKYYSEDFVTDAESSYEWYLYWNNSIVVATHNNKIVGFMNLFPISDTLYFDLLSGSYNDSNMVYEEINRPFDTDEIYHLFLSCVVIDEQYRHTDALARILEKYTEIYDDYYQKGFKFKSVITQNVTAEGINFSTKIGMIATKVADNEATICIGSYEHVREKVCELVSSRLSSVENKKVPKFLLFNNIKKNRFRV